MPERARTWAVATDGGAERRSTTKKTRPGPFQRRASELILEKIVRGSRLHGLQVVGPWDVVRVAYRVLVAVLALDVARHTGGTQLYGHLTPSSRLSAMTRLTSVVPHRRRRPHRRRASIH